MDVSVAGPGRSAPAEVGGGALVTDPASPEVPPARPVVRRRPDRGPRLLVVLVVLVAGSAAIAAGLSTRWFGLQPAPPPSACPTGVTLEGAGASFPAAVVSNWVAEFGAATSDPVNYDPAGAGQGVTLLTSKLVDFALTDEGVNGTERSNLVASVGPFDTLPVIGGAVVVVYNVPGTIPLELTGAQLAAIYRGNITNWGDPSLVAENPTLTGVNLPITTVHRADQSGMTYVFTNFLADDSTAWASDPSLGTSKSPAWPLTPSEEGASGNAQMVRLVQSVSGAIGYTDLYDALAKNVPTAGLLNPAGNYVRASVATTASAIDDLFAANPSGYPAPSGDWSSVSWVNAPGATDYPLATLVYFLVPADPSRGFTSTSADAEVLVAWLTYALTTGQGFNATAFPFTTPPPALLAADRAAVGAMTYSGQPIPVCG